MRTGKGVRTGTGVRTGSGEKKEGGGGDDDGVGGVAIKLWDIYVRLILLLTSQAWP